MTQARLDCEKPRSLWIEGSATFTIVASRTIISIPAHRTTRASHRESPAMGEVRVEGATIRRRSFSVTSASVAIRIAPSGALEPQDLVDENHRDAIGDNLAIDDEDLVDGAVYAVRRLGAGIFQRERVLVDPAEPFFQVRYDLLRPHDEDDAPGAADIRSELAPAHRGCEEGTGLGHRMDAAEHHVRRGRQAADLVGLGPAVQISDPRANSLVPSGRLDLLGDTGDLERLRCAVVNLRSIRDETQDDPLRLGRVCRPENADAVAFQGGHGPPHPRLTRWNAENSPDGR